MNSQFHFFYNYNSTGLEIDFDKLPLLQISHRLPYCTDLPKQQNSIMSDLKNNPCRNDWGIVILPCNILLRNFCYIPLCQTKINCKIIYKLS